jgi:hypothetical protein
MHGTRIEKEVEIFATNVANKTKCMSTNAKKRGEKKKKVTLFIFIVKNDCKYKKGLGNAHTFLCSTVS